MSGDIVPVRAVAGNNAVANDETLARYILYSRWIREDQTVRPDAFIPHPYPDLSVTRHAGFSEEQLWQIGRKVAKDVGRTLYGRADLPAQTVVDAELEPISAATVNNPNHVNIVGWPVNKAEQKSRAQKLAADSHYVAMPAVAD